MLAKGRARIGTKVSQSPSHFLLLHASSALSAASLEVLWLWVIVFTHIRPWMLLNSLNSWPSLTTVFRCSQAPQTWQFLKISSLSPYTHYIPNPSHPPTHTNTQSLPSHTEQRCRHWFFTFPSSQILSNLDSSESMSAVFLSPSPPLYSHCQSLRPSGKMTLLDCSTGLL